MPVCDLCFDCGCLWPGLGGVSHCDIQVKGAPDCPWCAYPWSGFTAMGFSALAGLLAMGAVPVRLHWGLRTLVGIVTLFGAAFVAGIVTSLWLGLPPLAGF
jgi:hypothetical protein